MGETVRWEEARSTMALAKVSGGFRHPSNDAAGLLFITAKEAAKRAKEYEGTLGEEL